MRIDTANHCLQATPDSAMLLMLRLWSGVPEAKRSMRGTVIGCLLVMFLTLALPGCANRVRTSSPAKWPELSSQFRPETEPNPVLLRTVDQLKGRWESFSLVSSNFSEFMGATNIVLCVYGLQEWEKGWLGDRSSAYLDAELRIKDGRTGKERIVDATEGPAVLGERKIQFGALEPLTLEYSFANEILTFHKRLHGKTTTGQDIYFEFSARLRKVSSDPGNTLLSHSF